MEYYCMGVEIGDSSCRVYAAPLYPTKAYLTCLYEDMVEDHYTYPLTEDVEHAAACRGTHQMTTCTNVSYMFCMWPSEIFYCMSMLYYFAPRKNLKIVFKNIVIFSKKINHIISQKYKYYKNTK